MKVERRMVGTLFSPWTKFVAVCVLLACCGVTGCANVATKVVTFRSEQLVGPTGTVEVKALREEVQPTLEFAHYKRILQNKLVALGYQLSPENEQSDYVVLLDYAVAETLDESNERLYLDAAHINLRRSRTDTVVVVNDRSDKQYKRTVKVVIAENTPEAPRLYEVTGHSEGECEVLSIVFDEMIDAMFTDFPAANGSTKTIRVEGDVRC